MRAPLPTTDALFAQEVEQKMSNLLAGFGAVQSFLDRTKHRTATQLAAAETSPGTSKIESNLPGWEDSNFDVTQADRLGRGSQCGREGFRTSKICNIGKVVSLSFPMEVSQSIQLATPRMSMPGLFRFWKNSLRHVGNSLTD